MREQLHRLDVRVAVDDAAGHDGPRVGLRGRHLAEPRDEIAQRKQIAGEPQRHRRRQPPVRRADDHQHAEEIDHDIVQHLGELDDRLAHGERRLHQLGGDAPGELVLVEGHRLLEQVAVHLPADAHGIVAEQRLVGVERRQRHQERQRHADDQRHARQLPPFRLKERLAVLHRQPVDDMAEEAEHPDLDDGDQRHQNRREQHERPCRPGEVPAEGKQSARRLDRLRDGKRIEPFFEPAEHDACLQLRPFRLRRRAQDPAPRTNHPGCRPRRDHYRRATACRRWSCPVRFALRPCRRRAQPGA